MAANPDLNAILRTIEEVEVSLERRAARASAFIMIVWGLVGASIFGLYQWYRMDPAPLVSVVGAQGVRWLWVGPSLLGYVLSLLARVRLGRMGGASNGAGMMRLLVSLVIAFTLIALIVLVEVGWQIIPAMMVGYLGYICLGWTHEGTRRADRAIAFASFGAALVLLLPPVWPWANGIAAVWYVLFLAVPGIVRSYR